jgi:signal transduction histidine kinase
MAIKVLLIDDDEDDCILIRDLLREVEGETFAVDWVPSYRGGIEAAAKKEHDIFLIDFRLGEFNGLDLLRKLLEDGVKIPMILLTGHGDREVDLEAMKVGAADYLVKGQLSSQLLARSIRYSIKHAKDLETLREREAHILHQDRLASIGLLASGLAHEIGTPLGVIRGRAEYLSMVSAESETLKKGLDVIISQIDRISKLIYSLLNLARSERSPIMTEVKVQGILDQVSSLMSHELRKHQIELKVSVPADARFKAEPEPLVQVVLNLMVNSVHAIEAASKSGRTSDHRITVSVTEQGEFWVLSVDDTGCGISEKNLGNIFKPFFTTKEIGVGTGLGLATSYKIVQSWGGSIQVQSKEGVGTVFRILLPKALST